MRYWLTVLATASIMTLSDTAAVFACINDRDTHRIEREYQKNYEFRSGAQEPDGSFESSPEEQGSMTVAGSALKWSGLGLMVLATGLVTHNLRLIRRS